MNVLERTYLGKKIPKQRFYENIGLSPGLQKKFVDYIDSVILLNKFSKDTLHIPSNKAVEEVFIFEVKLKSDDFVNKIDDLLEIIDRSIQYHILFKVKLDKKILCKIAYKNRSQSDSSKYVVDSYFMREFTSETAFEEAILPVFNALNMKVLYENILSLFLDFKEEGIEESVQKHKDYLTLQNEINELEAKMKKEKQADRQYWLHKELQAKKRELATYLKEINNDTNGDKHGKDATKN